VSKFYGVSARTRERARSIFRDFVQTYIMAPKRVRICPEYSVTVGFSKDRSKQTISKVWTLRAKRKTPKYCRHCNYVFLFLLKANESM